MTLKTQIQTDITAAMKAQNVFARDTLRLVLGAIQSAEKSGKTPKEFNEVELQEFLGKQVKERRASAEIYTEAGETARAEKETAEADLIAAYLPEQLTEGDVFAIVREEIDKIANPTARDMGAVMKAVKARVAGRFDNGKLIADVVKAGLV